MSGSNAAVEGLSGALGGVLALLSTYPLMTVSTTILLQPEEPLILAQTMPCPHYMLEGSHSPPVATSIQSIVKLQKGFDGDSTEKDFAQLEGLTGRCKTKCFAFS